MSRHSRSLFETGYDILGPEPSYFPAPSLDFGRSRVPSRARDPAGDDARLYQKPGETEPQGTEKVFSGRVLSLGAKRRAVWSLHRLRVDA